MKKLWHIKLIVGLAIMASPVISVFSCPCIFFHEMSIAANPKCCSCKAVPDQRSCCTNSSIPTHCSHSQASPKTHTDNSCKCPIDSTYSNITALPPGNHRIILETVLSNNFICAYILEEYFCATLKPRVEHIKQLKIPLYITQCAMLC